VTRRLVLSLRSWKRDFMAGEGGPPHRLIEGFPEPGTRIRKAYGNLWTAENGSAEEKKGVGKPSDLPRPWDPATCLDPVLREELWIWLEHVAEWINHEYVWEAAAGEAIPDCWPLHPHLVHELAVVADTRWRAGMATQAGPLEEWHRFVLPGFFERMRRRLKQSCDQDHQPWPAGSRFTVFTGRTSSARRLHAYDSDLDAAEREETLRLAKVKKGEVLRP
jgi:hypothetical protein